MLCLGQLLADCGSLFWGDDVIFKEAFIEAVSVFAVQKVDPPDLLTKLLQDSIVFLGQDPHRLRRMSAGETQFGQHVFIFCEGFQCRAVIDNVQCRLTLKHLVKEAKVNMKPFTRVYQIELRVAPYPRPLPIHPIIL